MRICSTAVATQNAIDDVYELPGLQLEASATVAPASSSRAGRGQRLPGGQVAGGQQRRDGVGAGQGVDIGVGEVGAVVDARRAELDRQPHARACAELVAVHAQAEPALGGGLQDPRGLVLVERARSRRRRRPSARCGATASSISPQTRST